ncbi:Foldase protein PrsA [Bacillus cereus]|nr:Foldase protein PrsA [Bacillus cereus]
MRGKHIFIITALISILMLSACEQKNGSATVATATDSTITKDNFEKTIERSLRKRHAIRNDGTRRHHKKI